MLQLTPSIPRHDVGIGGLKKSRSRDVSGYFLALALWHRQFGSRYSEEIVADVAITFSKLLLPRVFSFCIFLF